MRPAGTISDCPATIVIAWGPMYIPCRPDRRLPRHHRHMRLPDPHLGLAFAHGEPFLDRMAVRRRADAGRDPLFEHAKLRGTVARRDQHAALHARPPRL